MLKIGLENKVPKKTIIKAVHLFNTIYKLQEEWRSSIQEKGI